MLFFCFDAFHQCLTDVLQVGDEVNFQRGTPGPNIVAINKQGLFFKKLSQFCPVIEQVSECIAIQNGIKCCQRLF